MKISAPADYNMKPIDRGCLQEIHRDLKENWVYNTAAVWNTWHRGASFKGL